MYEKYHLIISERLVVEDFVNCWVEKFELVFLYTYTIWYLYCIALNSLKI